MPATRRFGTIGPYIEPNAIFGRVEASEGFIKTLLSLDPFDEYVFFLDKPKPSTDFFPDHSWPALARGAVRVEPTQRIMEEIAGKTYHCFHFPDPLADQTRLAIVRNRFSAEIFPITSVPHTLSYTYFAHDFLYEIWPGVSKRDVICATSRSAIDVISSYFAQIRANYSIPESWGQPGLRLIPLGVDTKKFQPPTPREKEKAREHFGIGQNEMVCLAHGRIAVDDKMDLLPLLYAVRRILEEEPGQPIHLIVSGKTRENDKFPRVLETYAKTLSFRFTLKDTPSNEERALLYSAADVFLSPSDNIQETFGLTVLEAGASGLPVIASDWDGYKDLVIPGETGILVPTTGPAETPYLNSLVPILPDNIHQLLLAQQTAIDVPAMAEALKAMTNENLRRDMGKKAREHVTRHYSWDTCVTQWVDLLDELWKIPIDGKENEKLRAAHHPGNHDYNAIFATYPTSSFTEEMPLVLTGRGKDVLRQKEAAVLWPNLGLCMKNVDVRKLLTLARHPTDAGNLIQRLGTDHETGQFAVLWALKHDLLEKCKKIGETKKDLPS